NGAEEISRASPIRCGQRELYAGANGLPEQRNELARLRAQLAFLHQVRAQCRGRELKLYPFGEQFLLVGKSAVDRGGSRRHGSWTPLEKGGFAQPSVSQIQPSRLPGTALHLRQLCAKRSISRSRHSWRAIAPCDSECQME